MLANFKGYGSPQTARGMASPFGPPPWHMSGRVFTIWYRLQDPDEARQHIAPPLQVPPDPLCRARFYDIAFDAGMGDDLGTRIPEQAQFHEAVVAMPVSYQNTNGDYSIHSYADNFAYIAGAREIFGWPVKMGKIVMSKEWQPGSLEPGVTITGVLERFGHCLMSASVTLVRPLSAEKRPAGLPNWFTYKVIPSPERPEPEVRELILAGPSRVEPGPIWEASALLEMGQGANDELHSLRPREIVSAEYWSHVDLTVGFGRILERF
jgi:acetoacetate decarboxylase